MPNALDGLERLIGPPVKEPPPVDWAELEAELGIRLPADYRALSERYAELLIDDFLCFSHPGVPRDPVVSARFMSR